MKTIGFRSVKIGLLLFFVCIASHSFCQTDSLIWALTSNGNGQVIPFDATINPGAVAKGSNLDGTQSFNSAKGFGTSGNSANGWNESSLNNAVSNNAFVEFSFQLDCSRNFIVDSLRFFAQTSNGSIGSVNSSSVKVSIDGSPFADITPVSTFPVLIVNSSEDTLNFNLNPNISLRGGQSIRFRIFASNIGNKTDTLYIRNFVIKGTKSTGGISSVAGSNATICAGTNTNISVSSISGGVAPYNVSWNNGGGSCTNVSENGNCIQSVSPSTTTTFTATIQDANGCTSTVSQTVTIKPLPTVASVSSNGPICEGNNLDLNCSPGGGNGTFSFQWSGPNSFTSTLEDPVIASASGAANGTYTVTVTSNGCIITGSVVAVVKPLPSINPVSSNSPVCEGQSLNLTSTPGGGNGTFTFQWSGPNAFSSTQEDPTISNVTTANSGIYTITVTSNGCTTTGNSTATVNTLPSINPVSNNGPVCAGQTLNLSSTPGGGNGTFLFLWSGPNAFTSTQEDPSITNATTAGSGIYTITVTSNNCSATSTTNATVNQGPIINPVANNGPICEGVTLQLTCTPSGGNGTFSFQWSGPNGFTSSIEDPSISAASIANGGLYTVSVTSNGCTTTGNTNANVKALPTIDPVGNNGPICSGNTLLLTSSPAAGDGTFTFQWTGPASFTSSLEDPSISNATTAATGTYTVTVTSNGCTATDNTTATVKALPTINPVANNSPLCEGSTLNLTSTPSAGNGNFTFQWTGPNAFTSTLEDPSLTNINASGNGSYTVIVTSNGCTASGNTSAVINTPSVAPSGINATDTIFCNGGISTLTLQGGSLGTNAKFKWYLNSCGGGAAIDSSNSITISPINNGSTPISQEFFVRAENTQSPCTANTGCVSRTIIINPIPERINLFPDTICSGQALNDTIISSFTNGVTYAWSTSGPASIISGNFPSPATTNNINTDVLINATTNQQPTVIYIDTLIFTNIIQCISISSHSVVVNPAAPKALVTDFVSATGAIPDNLCGGTQFNSFNVTNAVGGATYNWQVTPSNVVVHQPNSTNTVISFPDSSASYIATITAISFNEVALGGCPNDSTSFNINVIAGDPIQESKIILKQPGNLLVYLDNTPLGFQWGFDSKNTFLPSKIEGQVYQVLDHPVTLPFDTLTRDYWVIVYQNNCITKVYYNGPYSETKSVENVPIPDEINLSAMPNPNNGIFDLVISGNIYQNINICIWNNLGQQVYQEDIYKSEPLQKYSLILPRLSTGLYMVDVKGNHGEQATHKILIK